MVKAGKPVDLVIDHLSPLLDAGDMILDGEIPLKRYEKAGTASAGKGNSIILEPAYPAERRARFGPSIMPGGDKAAYAHIAPILETIAARQRGEPCCAYMGPDGAGHYVKMVHRIGVRRHAGDCRSVPFA